MLLTSFPVVITFLYGLKRATFKLSNIKRQRESSNAAPGPELHENRPKKRKQRTLPTTNRLLNQGNKNSIKENSFKVLMETIDYVVHVFFSQGSKY